MMFGMDQAFALCIVLFVAVTGFAALRSLSWQFKRGEFGGLLWKIKRSDRPILFWFFASCSLLGITILMMEFVIGWLPVALGLAASSPGN